MKKIKTVSEPLSENNNSTYNLYIPENSKILNTWIEKSSNQILTANLIFLIEYESHLEGSLHQVQVRSIMNSYLNEYLENYEYINTAVKEQFNMIPSTYGSNISFGIDVVKTYYHIFRYITLDESRDRKIENIIR